MSYNLDANKARQSESGGKFIKDAGKYVGQFTRAEKIVSKGGAMGIEFDFSDGSKSCTVTIWTHGKDGSELFGLNAISALMTVMRLKSMNESPQMVKKYIYADKAEKQVQAMVYTDLMNKPIGVLVQMEQYLNGTGELRVKPSFFCFFDAKSELIATEILDRQVSPKELEHKMTYVMECPLKELSKKDKAKLTERAASMHYTPQQAPAVGGDNFDDDIPF